MDELRLTAIHEAGHAVAFVRLRSDLPWAYPDFVTIEPGEDYLGRYVEASLGSEVRETGLADAIAVCAGYAATVAAGYSEDEATRGCGSDFKYVNEWTGVPLPVAMEGAVEFMRRPENVAAVARLAELLLARGTVDGAEVERVVDGT